jgi:hypothetical protein
VDPQTQRAIGALIFLVKEHSDDNGEIVLPEGWRDKVNHGAVLLDRRGDQDVLRVVPKREALRQQAARDRDAAQAA